MKTSVIALGFVSLFLSLACSSGGGGGNLPTDGGSGTGATGATGNGGSGGSGNAGNGGSGGATGGASGASGSGGSSASNTECGAFTSTTCLCTSVEPGQGNDEKCSPTENASGGYCCASAGWPNSSDCLCGPMLCNTVVDTCTCAIGLWSDGEDSCTGDECCLDSLGGCKCGPGACEGGGTPVTACDSTVFGCGPNSTMVPACH